MTVVHESLRRENTLVGSRMFATLGCVESLNTITELSREFGTPDFVKGGGGNTSVKTADTLWVKPSRTTLAGLTPATFIEMDRQKLAELYEIEIPADSHAREALVQKQMAAAVKAGRTGRPSVEAPLHDLLSGTYVVHTHCTLINGMTCARQGRAVSERLFPDALWVPYIDPGFTLCMDVRQRILDYTKRHGQPPLLLLLENHGIFVTGNTADEIRAVYDRVLTALRAEYAKAAVTTELRIEKGDAGSTRQWLAELLGAEAVGIAYGGQFNTPRGPLTPDHIVYAKSFPYEGALTAAGLESFRKKHGYTPLIYLTPAGVFAVGKTQKLAELALSLAQDGALIEQLAPAFGGIQYLDDRSREFIENWEVESYRQKQVY